MLQKVSLNIPFLTPNGNEWVFEVLHGDFKLVMEQGCRLRSGRVLRRKPVLPEWQFCESQYFISSTAGQCMTKRQEIGPHKYYRLPESKASIQSLISYIHAFLAFQRCLKRN